MNVVEKAFGKNMCTSGLSKVGSHPSALESHHGSLASETVIVLQAVGGGEGGGGQEGSDQETRASCFKS